MELERRGRSAVVVVVRGPVFLRDAGGLCEVSPAGVAQGVVCHMQFLRRLRGSAWVALIERGRQSFVLLRRTSRQGSGVRSASRWLRPLSGHCGSSPASFGRSVALSP